MSEAYAHPPADMTVSEFLDWAEDQPGRWQLRDGEPELMAPANFRHGLIHAELVSLLGNHLRNTNSPCRIGIEPGVVPRIRPDRSILVPDIAISCAPAADSAEMPDPVVLIEILSPSNARATRANVWAFATIPSVQEIILVHRVRIAAEVFRREPDGRWPEQPEMVGAEGTLHVASFGFEIPLRDAYRTANFGADGA